MKNLKNNIMKAIKVLKGDCVVLAVKGNTLEVHAGNKSAEEVKTLASTFFKEAYKLS